MLLETSREAARRFGETPAYVDPEGWTCSYRELDRVSDEAAAGLAARGIAPGEVVALLLPPGVAYAATYLAAAKLGAITAGVNERLAGPERAAVLARAEPRLVVTTGEIALEAGAVPARAETVTLDAATGTADVLRGLRVPGAAPPALAPDPGRPVAIVFTSGTTGTPKGALFGNRQLAWITAVDVGEGWGGGTRTVTGTSFAHLGFMTKLAGSLRRGGTSFVMRHWTAAGALALVARERVPSIAGVPTQLALMLRDPSFDTHDLSHVRALVVGGGPVSPRLATEARERFGAALATRYSCTEAGIGLGTSFDDPPEDAVVSVGRPHRGVELAVLDGDDHPVPPGEVGRVCLRSPAVMSGYWRDPGATAAAFTADGFVRTGDLGHLDGAGRLRLVGRAREMYVRGGYNVYPVAVEAVLGGHPAVAAVAVVPRADDVMGEVGVAVVVPADPARPPGLAELRAFGGERLARHELPEAISVVGELPRTPMEKLDRRALADLVARAGPGGDPVRADGRPTDARPRPGRARP